MDRITRIEVRPPYRLYVEFDDGVRGEYDMATRLLGPVFEPLKDPAYFAQVKLDEFGVPVWPNGTDLAPDALHDRLAESNSARSDAARSEVCDLGVEAEVALADLAGANAERHD